ncbi:MAG: murein L,D-transpeptidase catalytic domain family protein [Elusimicrobiales bacterium]|nr:murein L,D-transpeptidase catalytic domain family protein [Elusimicrobiales bacterium]
MKKIILVAMSVILSSGPLLAQNLERLRKSSENIRIETGSLKQKSSTTQYEIQPTPVLAQLIINFFKLLFSPNGDIEVTNPLTEVPQVEGTLEDDKSEEQYTESETYKPIDPAELQETPAAQEPGQPQQPPQYQQPPAGANNAGTIPEDLKRKALEYFNANQDKIKNKNYIGIVDFTAHSSRARFFILNMQSGEVHAMRVAHGKGSDPDGDGYATRFSNVPESKASSLGFYLTGALYTGSHGKSMRLLGQSSTNSNALSRAVVLHESAYVREANMTQGRSFGCLAVSTTEIRTALNTLNGGALIYAGLSGSEF